MLTGTERHTSEKVIDLTGQRFGRLVVLKEAGRNKHNHKTWLCKCDCGNEKVISGNSLRQRLTKSCGCYKLEVNTKTAMSINMSRGIIITNLIGQKFGRLTVIKDAGRGKHNNVLLVCKCTCGNEKVIDWGSLRKGDTKSCGCLRKELTSQRNRQDLTGIKYNRLYVIGHAYTDNRGKSYWNCVCDCGKEITVLADSLRSDKTKSCGCLRKEVISQLHKGENNRLYDPDREAVKIRKKVQDASRAMVSNVLRCLGKKKTASSEKLLGYTRKDLMEHLERLFSPGMSWLNHGKWHIDHVKPVAAFVKEGVVDLKIINALSNLQPLWARDNIIKNDKYNEVLKNGNTKTAEMDF